MLDNHRSEFALKEVFYFALFQQFKVAHSIFRRNFSADVNLTAAFTFTFCEKQKIQ